MDDKPNPKSRSVSKSFDFNIATFFRELFESYKWCLQNYPVYTKAMTSSTIAMIGEIFATFVKSKVKNENFKLDFRRVGIYGVYGLFFHGPMLHWWYTLLEYTLSCRMNLTGRAKVIAKVIIDRLLWGPFFIFFSVSLLNFLQTLSPAKTAEALRRNYAAVLLMNQRVWVPGQFINFGLIPVEYQVLFVNAVNIGWNTYLSFKN